MVVIIQLTLFSPVGGACWDSGYPTKERFHPRHDTGSINSCRSHLFWENCGVWFSEPSAHAPALPGGDWSIQYDPASHSIVRRSGGVCDHHRSGGWVCGGPAASTHHHTDRRGEQGDGLGIPGGTQLRHLYAGTTSSRSDTTSLLYCNVVNSITSMHVM